METKPFIASNTKSSHPNQRKPKFSQMPTQLSRSCKSPSNNMICKATRNLLDEPFFSGIKMERFEDEENFRVSTELSLSYPSNSLKINNSKVNRKIFDNGVDDKGFSTELCSFDESWIISSDQKLSNSSEAHSTQSALRKQMKRKFSQVSAKLSLSCNSTSKKMQKAAERKYDKIIMDNSKSIDLSDGTRNLLDEAFFPGIKTERFADGEENFRVSTELSLSFTSSSHKINKLEVNRRKISWDGVHEKGVSTKLSLFDESWINYRVEDPWKIKKKLTESDLGRMSRLLLPSSEVKKHLFPVLRAVEEKGMDVTVFDCDTGTKHNLVFMFWESSGAYVLKKRWNPDFVQRRGLKENDTVGLYWDVPTSTFRFSLLQRA